MASTARGCEDDLHGAGVAVEGEVAGESVVQVQGQERCWPRRPTGEPTQRQRTGVRRGRRQDRGAVVLVGVGSSLLMPGPRRVRRAGLVVGRGGRG